MIENEQTLIDRTNRKVAIFGFKGSYCCPISEKYGACKNCNLQNVQTPFDLCYEMIGKLKGFAGDLENKDILVFNLEFIEEMVYHYGVAKERIWFLTDCKAKAILCVQLYKGVNVVSKDFFDFLGDKKTSRKFDVVIANYPFQTQSNTSNTKTQAIWDKFAVKSGDICKDGGFIVAIHPSGWRSSGKIFEEAKSVLKSRQIKYLEIHDEEDGIKTFGATTRYDWYVIKNEVPTGTTTIKDQDGNVVNQDLSETTFIPNSQIDKVFSMIARNGEETIETLYSRSAYGSDKPNMSIIRKNNFIYPVVYSTPVRGATIWYSTTNQNGHFGVPKLIFNPCRPIGFVIDYDGEYGMSQFCVGIIGNREYLETVAEVFKNQKTNGFSDFMETCHFTDKIFNKEAFSLFRKDLWKEFV